MRVADDRFPHVEVRSADELRDWLAGHHDRDEAVWLVTWKKVVPERYVSTEQVLDAAGLTHADIDLFVYHQANRRILASLAEHYELDTDKVVDAIGTLGNTSAASVPLALEQARGEGRLRPGAKLLLGAAGAGFTWSAALLEWGTA